MSVNDTARCLSMLPPLLLLTLATQKATCVVPGVDVRANSPRPAGLGTSSPSRQVGREKGWPEKADGEVPPPWPGSTFHTHCSAFITQLTVYHKWK